MSASAPAIDPRPVRSTGRMAKAQGRVTQGRVFRSEWTKLYSLRSTRYALLATAVITSDASLLRTAMDDRLHQPYRLPLLPGTAELIATAYDHGAAGAALSGAGPSVLAICDSPISAHSVEKAWNVAGVPGMAARLRFDTGGARLSTPPTDR